MAASAGEGTPRAGVGSRAAAALAALLVFAVVGCSIDMPPADFAMCALPAPQPDAGVATPDYWHDAKPILDAKCGSCHTSGGIAPFMILTYADVQARAATIRGSIASRHMPPWPPNNCCQQYQHDRSLDEQQRDTLLRWLDAGAPMGDPAGAPPSQPPPPLGLSRVDVTLRMPQPYVPMPTEETSELRCFVVEGWPHREPMFVTGLDVRPGNRSVVHHVIVQTIDAGAVAELKAREGRDGRPGFDCRDSRGELHVNGYAGGWTPGGVPQESPDGTLGIEFAANSQVLLQVHYDVRNGAGMPAQIEIDFQVARTVKHRIKGMVVVNPLWLAGDALDIPAGSPDSMHNFAYDPTVLFGRGRSLFVHSVNLHMHGLGSYGRVAVQRAAGNWDCLLDIPAWDYHWASGYQLVEPVEIRPGDMLYVECHWDNTAANQLPVNGVRPPPRDQRWGTAGEMCAGILAFTETWP
jgi:hypothetical protein